MVVHISKYTERPKHDGIFFLTNTDWYRFEDVIGAMLNINLMDNTNGFQVVGRRVEYDG